MTSECRTSSFCAGKGAAENLGVPVGLRGACLSRSSLVPILRGEGAFPARAMAVSGLRWLTATTGCHLLSLQGPGAGAHLSPTLRPEPGPRGHPHCSARHACDGALTAHCPHSRSAKSIYSASPGHLDTCHRAPKRACHIPFRPWYPAPPPPRPLQGLVLGASLPLGPHVQLVTVVTEDKHDSPPPASLPLVLSLCSSHSRQRQGAA